MRCERLLPDRLLTDGPGAVIGAILLAPARLPGGIVAKGTRVDDRLAAELREAAAGGSLTSALRLAWPGPTDLPEDEAALRLARAIAGPPLEVAAPKQSRVDLVTPVDGVLRVNVPALSAVNLIDPLEVFTLFHGQAVRAGQVVASTKVAPHLVHGEAVEAGEALAREAFPVVAVAPYLPLEVAAIAAEALPPAGLARFEEAARAKVTALGGRFLGLTQAADADSVVAARALGGLLEGLVCRRGVPLLLVGGVSAGDPLSPFFAALARLGGTLLRRGVPAHPGSMIWLASLGDATLLGLPQCGMFSMATAADLVLPRLLTGERISPESLADLGHGGLLGREMRFRLPDYARELEAPE